MNQYHTNTPPVLNERDGKFYVTITDGKISIEAPIGRWFMAELLTKLLIKLVMEK